VDLAEVDGRRYDADAHQLHNARPQDLVNGARRRQADVLLDVGPAIYSRSARTLRTPHRETAAHGRCGAGRGGEVRKLSTTAMAILSMLYLSTKARSIASVMLLVVMTMTLCRSCRHGTHRALPMLQSSACFARL
jgi:hypothetical protein